MSVDIRRSCLLVAVTNADAVRKAGVGRRQWAAPRGDSFVQHLINADMTSSSTDSASLADDDNTQSPPGYCTGLPETCKKRLLFLAHFFYIFNVILIF